MKKSLFSTFIFLCSFNYFIYANINKWSDNDVIIIKDQNIFTITDKNAGTFQKNKIILIANEKGKEYCNFEFFEDDYMEITNIEACIKDTSGNIIKELDDDQIKETSLHFGSILHSDNVKKYFTFDHFSYPYIIELSYEKKIKTLLIWPDWLPQENYPVITSEYKLILKEPTSFHTHYKGIKVKPQKSIIKNDSIYFWQMDSIPAIPEEPLLAPEDGSQYHLLFAPFYFSTNEVTGSFKSWDLFSEWIRKLYHNKYNLDQTIKTEIDNITKNVESDLKKIQLIYELMQEKTRYVAIELGIGGWQPYSANSVYANRYGDCKDLSTFMIAALKHVGIKSYPVLVRTRDRGIVYKDFPKNYFNHVVSFVPLGNDTIWLENTADHLLAGELPWADEGCNVLAVLDTSGNIITTPISKSNENSWKSKIEGEITPQGTFIFIGKINLYGNQKHWIWARYTSWKREDFEDWFKSKIGSGIPGFKLEWYNIENVKFPQNTCVKINFRASIKKFGNKTGQRLFINPNILNERTGTLFEENETRKYPIWFDYAYLNADTVSIKFPFGYKLEAAPKEQSIEFPFGRYNSSHEMIDNVFKHYRHFEYTTNYIPADQYEQVVEFTNTAIKKDQSKYVFKKH